MRDNFLLTGSLPGHVGNRTDGRGSSRLPASHGAVSVVKIFADHYMLAIPLGLGSPVVSTLLTLVLVPCVYSLVHCRQKNQWHKKI